MNYMKDDPNRKKDLANLLLLLIIFSMLIALRVNSVSSVLNDSNIIFGSKNIYKLLLVPCMMGTILLYYAFYTSNKSLKKIYILSILPFLVSPDILIFLNNLLFPLLFNILLTFLLIIIIFKFIIMNYSSVGRVEKPDASDGTEKQN